MKLLLKILRREDGEIVEITSDSVEAASIAIGRGTGAQIRLSSESVAPIHALLDLVDAGLQIQDLGSTVGTLVNHQRVLTAILKDGDKIQIGASEFHVFIEDNTWGLAFDAASMQQSADEQQVVAAQLDHFDLRHWLPSMMSLCLFVTVVIFLYYFFWPIQFESPLDWNSGPVSSAHKFIEQDCKTCHSEPFKPVQDADCLVCHTVAEHPFESKQLSFNPAIKDRRCAECHLEHNGKNGLHIRDSRQCTECHGDIRSLNNKTLVKEIGNFAQHTQFRISIAGEGDKVDRFDLGSEQAVDKTNIKLNHHIHLKKDIRGAKGVTTLTCASCHALTNNKRAIKPISFEANCRSCHPLEFDTRFPGEEVPHGSELKVRDFLFSKYSQLVLSPEDKKKISEAARLKPGQEILPELYNKASLDLIYKEIKGAEEMLYNKTGCQLCHEFNQGNSDLKGVEGYKVSKPKIPARWLENARFSHRAHLHMKCLDCHNGASKSIETKDVLLPKIESCRECHADVGHPGKVDSDCVMCHGYHEVHAPS